MTAAKTAPWAKRLAFPAAGLLVTAVAVVLLLNARAERRAGDSPPTEGQVQAFALAEAPRPAPEAVWHDGAGREVALADFRGRIVMVNFWATWCAPCVRELPSIDRLQTKLAGEDFTVVAINVDAGGADRAAAFAEELQIDALPLNLDPRMVAARAMDVAVMPTTVIYDREGKELGRMEGGAEWDSPEAVALLQWFIERV